jgi:M-phase inducer tyrosine phosphatase
VYSQSDTMVPTAKSLTTMPVPRRARSGSSDGSDLRDTSQLQRPSLPPLHPTIIESPSPNSLQQHEDFGNYFFDPQSPQHPQPPSHRNSISSTLAADGAGRPRTFQKSATLAVVPSTLSIASTSSLLGKRGNPYAKRPSLGVLPTAPLSAHAYAAGASESHVYTTTTRMTAPAPRRRHSALDNSAAFAAQASEDLSMNSIDHGDSSEITSPSDNRGKMTSANRLFPPDFDASGSPIAPTSRPRSRPSMLRMPSKDDSSPLGYGAFGKRLAAKQTESIASVAPIGEDSGSVSSPYRSAEGLPGFGASEREGKILPCFNIKNDGLMRIKPSTLVEVMDGIYNHQMDGFQIVDCRFGYEYEGGHIAGAINLSTVEAVVNHFLNPESTGQLPRRSQSGKPDSAGVWKKKVLIFHCEFSAKRAPSMALALRQADRGLVHDYPNCHYPEVYILEGGYCGFFKQYDSVCEPRFYVQMDDPKFLDKRSKELNGFRKQFSRHRSFAFGETINNTSRQFASEGGLINNPSFGKSFKEDGSFDNSSASPSAVQADIALARRKLTKGISNPSRLETSFKGIGIKAVVGSAPATTGDLSFGCSSFGDSSFEGGPSDSPCAAAATNRRPSTVPLKAGKEGTPAFNPSARGTHSSSLARHSFQRASTAAHIQMR